VPKFRNYNFNTVVLVIYDIISNFIKIDEYLVDGPRMGPKVPELCPKCPELVPKAQFRAQTKKLQFK
jgi:hypothetical protein